ncbi:tetratricopeptide repeat protein, partial [Polynucleobacter sp.]
MDNFELGRQYFLDGLDLISRGDFDGAESKFISSLDLVPNRISTLTNLAVAQLKLKKYSTAKVTSEKAIALDSKNQEAYLNLGLVEQELRRYDEAINHYDKALAL